MPVTVTANGLTVVHKGSGGVATATAPDVCKTPSAGGPVPLPYPNVALSADLVGGTATVIMDGHPVAVQGSKLAKSTGDEAGVAGGLMSGVVMGEAQFISFSPTVAIEGKAVCRLSDKLLMNKGNTVCMAGIVQAPLPPPAPPIPESELACLAPAPAREAAKQCVLRGVLVSCSHNPRAYQADLSKGDVQVLQVIAKPSEPEKLLVEWDGDCGHRNRDCPSIRVVAPSASSFIDRATHAVHLPAPGNLLVRDWKWIFHALLSQADLKPDYYTLLGMTCGGQGQCRVPAGQWLQVQVFPQAEWTAKFKLGYSHENKKDDKGEDRPFEYKREATWKIAGEAEFKYGDYEGKFKPSVDVAGEAIPWFEPLLDKIGASAKVFECMARYGLDVKLTPEWPNWEFGGGMKLVELPGKALVGSEGSFTFGFDPLFGMKMEVSILDWLIRFAGALAGPSGLLLARTLLQLRKRFAKSVLKKDDDDKRPLQASLDIDIVLTVTGNIKGSVGIKMVNGKTSRDPDASVVDGGVDVHLKGHVIGKGRFFSVTAGAGGEIGVAAPQEGSGPKKPSRFSGKVVPQPSKSKTFPITAGFNFTGLAIYYWLYVEVGIASAENEKKHKHEDARIGTTSASATKTLVERRGECVLMNPWSATW